MTTSQQRVAILAKCLWRRAHKGSLRRRSPLSSQFSRRQLVPSDPSLARCFFSTSAHEKDSSSDFSQSNSVKETRQRIRNELDFFGEPVTFRGAEPARKKNDPTVHAMGALDGFLLAVISKGRSCIGGGDEAGLDVKPAHSVALSWAEVLRHAAVWNRPNSIDDSQKSCPMLAVVAVAPLLAQVGVTYARHLDTLLKQAKPGAPGLPKVQMIEIAKAAVALLDNQQAAWINERERMHLEVLRHFLNDENRAALACLLRILRLCPGDALALSLAMDISQTLGDKQSALRYEKSSQIETDVEHFSSLNSFFLRQTEPQDLLQRIGMNDAVAL